MLVTADHRPAIVAGNQHNVVFARQLSRSIAGKDRLYNLICRIFPVHQILPCILLKLLKAWGFFILIHALLVSTGLKTLKQRIILRVEREIIPVQELHAGVNRGGGMELAFLIPVVHGGRARQQIVHRLFDNGKRLL